MENINFSIVNLLNIVTLCVTILFILQMKFYRQFGTKKFYTWLMLIGIPLVALAAMDPNFLLILTWPDNVPISLLILSVGFFTWYSFHKAAKNKLSINCPFSSFITKILE